MFRRLIAQMRTTLSMALGIPFSPGALEYLARTTPPPDRAASATTQAKPRGREMLDVDTRREIQLRRFRKQASRAAQETAYYTDLFAQLDIDPAQLRFEDIARIPLTPKAAVRDQPDAFVRSQARPFWRTTTTGTTGKPTGIHFSQDELRVYFALAAIANRSSGTIGPEDIVQISVSSLGALGNTCLAGSIAHIGALVYQTGVIDPARALQFLREEHHIAGKKPRASVLYLNPSYLGYLVECGLQQGLSPGDFGLERIAVGGEIVTQGLKRRAEQLFGPVAWSAGYGITELWPLGGDLDADDHLHFDGSRGLVEVYNHETQATAQPGEVGTIVATPFPPFRETTLLLRYDTEDLVRLVTQEPGEMPITSNILGKQRLSVHHDQGWTYPREVIEALEALEGVPLPAQFGFWPVAGGVALEVVVRQPTAAVKGQIEAALVANGVPVHSLDLKSHASELTQPYPLRGNLREGRFEPTPTQSIIERQPYA